MGITESSKFREQCTQLVVWIPKGLQRQLKDTLARLQQHGIMVTQSDFVRNALFDRISQIEFLLSLMEKKREVKL